MSKFDEMKAAAIAARKDWSGHKDRCLNYFVEIIQGFILHCSIPPENISFLRWNDQTKHYEPCDDNKHYTLPGAVVFDEKEELWRLGIHITFTQVDFVGLGLALTESASNKLLLRMPGEKTVKEIDFLDSNQKNKLFNDLIDEIISAYKTPKPENGRTIGFVS
jgi:hypothetical protein